MRRIFLVLFGLFFMLVSSTSVAQELGEIKASLQRGSSNKIRVSFSVLSLDATDFTTFELGVFGDKTAQNGSAMLTKFLDVCIFDSSINDRKCSAAVLKVAFARDANLDKTPVAQLGTDYSASILEDSTSFVLDEVTRIYKLNSSIEINASNASKTFSPTTIVSLRLNKGASTDLFNEGEKAVSLAVAVDAVPSELGLIKSKASLTASWQTDEQVNFADASTGLASGVLGFIVPESRWSGFNVPIQSYEGKDLAKELSIASSCTVTPLEDAGTCTLTCVASAGNPALPDKHYFKQADLNAAEYNAKDSGPNSSVLSFSGLSKDSRYALVLQYQPDGLQRSCLIGTPSDAVTLTELGGASEPTIKDPRCFIATAAYGSALDPHLESLRWFRDHVLLLTRAGRAFVRAYYEFSPNIAAYIQTRPVLQSLTRSLLWLPVLCIEGLRQHPLAMTLLMSCAGLLPLVLWRRRLRLAFNTNNS